MPGIPSYSTFYSKLASPYQTVGYVKANFATSAGQLESGWQGAPNAAATPTTSASLGANITGALGQVTPTGVQRLLKVVTSMGTIGNAAAAGAICVADRLCEQGGLDGTVTTAQTTNLPTVALPRYTSGVGVMAALEIYSAVGASVSAFSCSYTNSAGVAGKISPAAQIGGSGYNSAKRILLMPLAAGDVGVKSVESVMLSVTTGTAGAFGVTLFYPLLLLPQTGINTETFDALMNWGGYCPQIQGNACLFEIVMGSSAAAGDHQAVLTMVEES